MNTPSRFTWFFTGWDAAALLWSLGTGHYTLAALNTVLLAAMIAIALIEERRA